MDEQQSNLVTKTCQCGCGLEIKSGRQYVQRHHSRKSFPEYRAQDCGYITPCWVWQRVLISSGYGQGWSEGKKILAHRMYYEQAYGPIAPGLVIDHLCEVRACVNPEHLEVVTQGENQKRRWARYHAKEARRRSNPCPHCCGTGWAS